MTAREFGRVELALVFALAIAACTETPIGPTGDSLHVTSSTEGSQESDSSTSVVHTATTEQPLEPVLKVSTRGSDSALTIGPTVRCGAVECVGVRASQGRVVPDESNKVAMTLAPGWQFVVHDGSATVVGGDHELQGVVGPFDEDTEIVIAASDGDGRIVEYVITVDVRS